MTPTYAFGRNPVGPFLRKVAFGIIISGLSLVGAGLLALAAIGLI